MQARREQEKADKLEKAKEHGVKLAKLEEARAAKVERDAVSHAHSHTHTLNNLLFSLSLTLALLFQCKHNLSAGMNSFVDHPRWWQRRKRARTRRSARGRSRSRLSRVRSYFTHAHTYCTYNGRS
jgi:hypothetical protein